MSAERHVTEEGFPVRTIYVSYFPMNVSNIDKHTDLFLVFDSEKNGKF